MPSALETLVKILKLEQDTDYNNTAVIGGLKSYATNWEREAHQQAKIPEHHQLVDELVSKMHAYNQTEDVGERHEVIKYMLGRIMGRIPAPPDLPPSSYVETGPEQETGGSKEAVPEDQTIAPQDAPPPAPSSPDAHGLSPGEEESSHQQGDRQAEATSPPPSPRRRKKTVLSLVEAEARMGELQQSATILHKVGEKMADKLARLGIFKIEDMLFKQPRRYDDYTQMRTLNKLQPGETVTVIAEIRSVSNQQGRGARPYLRITVDDDTAVMDITFFGQPWLQRQFKRGNQVVLSGTVELFRGRLTMTNPEWEMLERENIHTQRIVPVYALTKGLAARTMRRLMHQVVDLWKNRIPDYMPNSVLERTELPDLGWTIEQTHFPDSFEALTLAQKRLSFDELFLFQMAMLAQRREWQSEPGQPLDVSDEWLGQFIDVLPYELTGAQQRVLNDTRDDMARPVPMNRLLQGDVGSGKTVVAAAALAIAVQAGKQAALMAPTSILAEQHARSVGSLLTQAPGSEHVQVRLLTGNTSAVERDEIYRGLADGSIHVVIGTHALIQGGVEFANLGLAIIDEQHRFGVEQRGALRGKGYNPHLLVMTATPIPRTLALTLYADLDLSIIDEMPPGRTPVETRVLTPRERERAYSFITSQIERGRQAFIVFPLVEESEKLDDVGAAVEGFERLSTEIFAQHRVGLLHGRMAPSEKEAIMSSFAAGEIDILVSTSVVEVGIDVPNASVIMIENANRFGLAQLHQFRGRVGRGAHQSYCLLMAENTTEIADERLSAMEETTDGFKLAEIDWKLRGAGDLLGVRQSGMGQFQLAEVMNPRQVELAQREARTIFAEDPMLSQPEHALIARRIQSLQTKSGDIS